MPGMVARPLVNEWMQGDSKEEVRKGGLGEACQMGTVWEVFP